MILDMIEKNSNITQREMSKTIGIAVSMVNDYLDEYEKKGFIKRKYLSTKNVEYIITKKGIERIKVLNIWYLKSTHSIYQSAKNDIFIFLNQIINRGFKKILLYGAGEVAEIILQVMNDDITIPIDVIAVIDDDISKQQKPFVNLPVISINEINNYLHDSILISSYTHHEAIKQNLMDVNYPTEQILEFFD